MSTRELQTELIALGIGSNEGDSFLSIYNSFCILSLYLSGIRISSIYKTTPLYNRYQPTFLNAVIIGCYSGSEYELLGLIQRIESLFGRKRYLKYGSRTLDIDILLFGNHIVQSPPRLIIPHPLMYERRFVLVPLVELLPDCIDPLTRKPFAEMINTLPIQGIFYQGSLPWTKYTEKGNYGVNG